MGVPPDVQGGLGRYLHTLAEASAAAGHEVVVLTGTGIKSAATNPLDTATLPGDIVINGVRIVRASLMPFALAFDVGF